MNIQNLYDMVNAVKGIIPLREAYLFGSYAYGEPHQESDYDLYFVADSIKGSRYDIIAQIYGVIDDVREKPVDILLNTKEHFDGRKEISSTLEYKIARDGIKLYGQ